MDPDVAKVAQLLTVGGIFVTLVSDRLPQSQEQRLAEKKREQV